MREMSKEFVDIFSLTHVLLWLRTCALSADLCSTVGWVLSLKDKGHGLILGQAHTWVADLIPD